MTTQTILEAPAGQTGWDSILRIPDAIMVETDGGFRPAKCGVNEKDGIRIDFDRTALGARIKFFSPHVELKRVHFRWNFPISSSLRVLGDEWERGYGNLHWGIIHPERILPWYFLVTDGQHTRGVGVRTQAHALCWWRVDGHGVSLWLDVRNGGVGVRLGERELTAAEIVVKENTSGTSLFEAASAFCHALCDAPRLADHIVYGSNNWYYAYGDISTESVREDGRLIQDLTQGLANRPYMVIDDGWQINALVGQFPLGGPWNEGNKRFPDMPGLARELKSMNTRPGLWTRPLGANPDDRASLLLPPSRASESSAQLKVLDPSNPEVLQRVEEDCRLINEWGYELIKHDWTCHDIFGRWGSALNGTMTLDNWHFYDRTRTTAEIILALYRAIRRGAGSSLVMGCNTIGHLSAGLFELQRTGDDTSGKDWERTRRMGINTLAFRMPQHNAFFAVDADCVGITGQIPWQLNAQWLDLLSRSGTPLFVSADPKAVGPVQREALREAFAQASQAATIAEPLDWVETYCPALWKISGKNVHYEWIGDRGIESVGAC